MDVTRQNFATLLPSIRQALSKAEFISLDLELTGLTSAGKELNAMPFDTPRQYYEKVYQRSLDFLPIQLGACIFLYDSSKERYTYQAYNFFIFPFSKLKGFPNSTFLCQSSSLAFLSDCGFDFNKAFGAGIPFLTQPEEDKLRSQVEERQQKTSCNSSKETAEIPIPDDSKVHLENNMKRIRDFLDEQNDDKDRSLIMDRCNAFMRRLLYQEVPKEFGDAVQLETCDDSSFAMKVMIGGGEEVRKQREQEKKDREWRDFDEAVGISQVIKLISESGKPIIGHNCLLDICHIVNRFRYPLPSDYENFKELVHHIFPRIFDTKYMSVVGVFKEIIASNVLGHLKETLSQAPFEMPVVEGSIEGCSYSELDGKFHEGGYDALITGQCFLAMCQYLAKHEGKKIRNLDLISDILSPFENRLYLMRVQDIPYIRVGAPDLKPPRSHVFHLKFPREWKQYDIVDLFKPFGPVFISFIDDRSAFVALHKKDQAKFVLKSLTASNLYKLSTFAAHQKQCGNKSPPLTNPSSPTLRKRKVHELSEATESSSVFKKQCNVEQATPYSKRSIEPIPEEAETETTGASPIPVSNAEQSPKVFQESEVWG